MRLPTGRIYYGWWIVLATNVICMLGFGTWLYSFGVFFKPMMTEFGWTRAMTAGAASLRSVQGGVAGPIVGWAVDKYGSRGVVLIGGVISGLGFILMYFVNSLAALYIIYGVVLSVGMSFMLYIPAFTVLAKWFRRKLSRALSVLAVGAGLGGLIFSPLSAFLIQHLGWRFAFVAIGVMVLAVVIPLSFVIRETPAGMGLRVDGDPPEDGDGAGPDAAKAQAAGPAAASDYTLKQALRSKTFWLLGGAFFCQSLVHGTVFIHAVPHLTDIGISMETAAFSVGLLTMVSVIGRLSIGSLGDFIDKRYLFMVSYTLMGLGVIALLNAHTMPLVYLFIALFGVGFGANVPLMPAIQAEYFGQAALGKIQGFTNPVSMVAGATGPVLAGHLFDQTGSYRLSFLLATAMPFLAAGFIFFIRPSTRRKASA
jgi:MFS family permease